jgi:LysM repeat protein
VRVEAALDAVTVDPAGSTVVVWDIDGASATTSCAVAGPAPITGPLVYASGFGGTCGPATFTGQLTLANRGSYPQDVKANVSLARLDGGAWIAVDGLQQTFSTTIEPGASVSIPVTFPLAGMVADTPAVRIEASLTAIDFVAGQARRTQESAIGPAVECPPAPGTPGKEKYTVALGDTLASVANAHRVNVEDLAAANGLDGGARLVIGQSLSIPKTAIKPVTTATSGSSGRGTIAPGEPVVRPTKTPSPTAEPTATEEPTPRATKTAIPGAATGSSSEPSTPAGGQGPGDGDPAGESSGGGMAAMLVPVGLGLVAIFVAGGSALGAVFLLRKLRSRPRGPANAPAGMAAAAPAALPPQQPVPAPAAQTKKPGTREDPAAIPLSGDMRDLLGIERNRTAVAKAFVPDPAAVAPGRAILEEARELARALGRVA